MRVCGDEQVALRVVGCESSSGWTAGTRTGQRPMLGVLAMHQGLVEQCTGAWARWSPWREWSLPIRSAGGLIT